MAPKERNVLFRYLFITWIVFRVIVTLAFWMALILGAFIGYLTIPIILVSIVIIGFAINDATRFSVRLMDRSRKGRG